MSLDDALARAGQILADYKSPGAQDESGLALVWGDQLAGVRRERADAASAWRAGLERPAVTVTGPVPVRSGDRGPGRVRGWLAAMPGAGAALVPAERGAVLLPADDPATPCPPLAHARPWPGATAGRP